MDGDRPKDLDSNSIWIGTTRQTGEAQGEEGSGESGAHGI
jgi:hypothetical protein